MLDPIKVLHVFSTFDLGGAQARTIQLIEAFGDKYEHHIAAMDSRFGATSKLGPRKNVQLVKLQIKKSAGLANGQCIRDCVDAIAPATLITYNWGAVEWTLAKLPRAVKRIHVEEGFSVDEAQKRFFRRNLLRRIAFKIRPIYLVTVSNTLREISSKEWGITKNRSRFIPNGVDTELFYPSTISAEKVDSNFVFGTVCGLRPEKRLERLIDAFSELPKGSAVLKIAGDGPLRKSLVEQVNRLGLQSNVLFLGHLENPAPFYRDLHAYVLVSGTEQAPLSLLEAMSSALPCVVTNVGDMQQMLPVDHRRYIANSDVTDIRNKLLQCMQEYRGQLPNNRLHVQREFSFENMVAQWDQLISNREAA